MYSTKCLICVLLVLARPACSTILTTRGSKGSYCARPVFRQISDVSTLRCANECSSDAQCMASSMQHGSQCLLHDDFCLSADLVADEASLYAEPKWACSGSSCYYMPTLRTPMLKSDADAVCETMGAHVVATETEEENEYINQLVYHSSYYPAAGTNGQHNLWIDIDRDVTWKHSGESVTFTNWGNSNEGVTTNSEYCAVMAPSGNWGDVRCTRNYAFICEI